MIQFLKGYGRVKGGWVLAPAKHYGLMVEATTHGHRPVVVFLGRALMGRRRGGAGHHGSFVRTTPRVYTTRQWCGGHSAGEKASNGRDPNGEDHAPT